MSNNSETVNYRYSRRTGFLGTFFHEARESSPAVKSRSMNFEISAESRFVNPETVVAKSHFVNVARASRGVECSVKRKSSTGVGNH